MMCCIVREESCGPQDGRRREDLSSVLSSTRHSALTKFPFVLAIISRSSPRVKVHSKFFNERQWVVREAH